MSQSGTVLGEDVFEGTEGWLFLARGSNNVGRLFSLPDHDITALVAQWSHTLHRRRQIASEQGIKYLHCFVPDKISVMREEAADLAKGMRFPADMMEERRSSLKLDDVLVPLTAYLRKQKNTYRMFHKTDTHWTILGCFSAYQMICFFLGAPQRAELAVRPSTEVEGYWDLGSKLNPKRSETIRFGHFGKGAKRTYANPIVTVREEGLITNNVGLHVGSIVEYTNTEATSEMRLLIFGDSFCEYRAHLLTGMLAETVRSVMFVWSSSIDWDIVRDYRPNVVLTEMAERFIATVPADDLDLRAHAERKLAEALGKQGSYPELERRDFPIGPK